MGKKIVVSLIIIMVAVSISIITGNETNAQEVLQGDKRYSCEALLCFAAPSRPGECGAAIARFFSIRLRSFKDTIQARKNFLSLCPDAGSDSSLVNAIVYGADRCDAASLNQNITVTDKESGTGFIRNYFPRYCADFYNHPLINAQAPRYVGTPMLGGYWVEAENYEAAIAVYNAKIAASRLSTQQRN